MSINGGIVRPMVEYNAMAFFNSGLLAVDIVLRQLIIVIMACVKLLNSWCFILSVTRVGHFRRYSHTFSRSKTFQMK